jgi:putative Holliday junction resolvase
MRKAIPTIAAPEILLAFDYGARRIGVATANRHTRTASPSKALRNGSNVPWTEIDTLIEEWRPAALLVGLPGEGDNADISAAAAEFAQALTRRYSLPVTTVDETLTSRAARSELNMARRDGLMTRKIKRTDVDSLAACLIAEQWLRAQ